MIRRLSGVLIAAVALVACGGGSDSSSTTAAATTVATTELASTTTKAATTTAEATTAAPTTEAPTTTIARTTTTVRKDMPDLAGKTTADAKAALASLGVTDVRIEEQENIAAPGTVLTQVPSKGSTITGPVDLTVAKALSPMPDWVGKTISEARDYFTDRGVVVTVVDQLDDVQAEGTITGSTPAAGESIGAEVRINVVKRPVTRFLAKTDSVDKSCRTDSGDIGVNGATQLSSVVVHIFDRSAGDGCFIDYNLSRSWVRLKGGVGISDVSKASLQCRFELFADGNPIFNETAGLGVITPVDLDMTDVLRLRLQVTPLSDAGGDCVWTSLRLIGSGTAS